MPSASIPAADPVRAGRADHTNLVALRDRGGEGHFARVALADRLLKNKAWVAAPDGGGGHEGRAIDRLEADCFGDICGAIGLPQLLELYHKFPSVKTWREHKHNYKAMFEALRKREHPRPAQRREFSVPRNDLIPPLSFPERTPGEQRKEYAKAFDKVEHWKTRAEKAERELAQWKDRAVRAEAELAKRDHLIERVQKAFGTQTA